jgi:hypothetical protein
MAIFVNRLGICYHPSYFSLNSYIFTRIAILRIVLVGKQRK